MTARHFLVLLALFFGACSKENLSNLDNYEQHNITSTYLKKSYHLQVLYPKGYDKNKSYHTVFLLDANDYFEEMVGVINQHYSTSVVLIGLDYNNFDERVKDFTYPADSRVAGSGQANNYIQFLNQELLPFVAGQLKINSSDKTIMGHSLTGYFTSYLLFQQDFPVLFDNIISASPSLWWDSSYIFGLEERYNQNQTALQASYFITMGDLEGAMMNVHFKAFTQKLVKRNYQSPAWKKKGYENISHRNSPILSFEDGLSFIY